MRRPKIAPEFVFATLALVAGAVAFAGEPQPSQTGEAAQQTPPREGRERVNPTRRLEVEIEGYPAPPPTATDDATRIPEVVEERPGAPPNTIERSEVQPVVGRSAMSVPLDELDTAQVTLLQQRLRERGHYLGRIDGIAGPQTRAAVQALLSERFALERRLLEQGQITSELAELVGITVPRAP